MFGRISATAIKDEKIAKAKFLQNFSSY